MVRCFLFFLLVFPVSAQFGGLRFREMPGLAGVSITGINDRGEMVGNHPQMGAVSISAVGEATALGVEGVVRGLNDRGQMLVMRDNRLFLRQADGRLDAREVPDAPAVSGGGLNNLGQVAGIANGEALVWDVDGSVRRLQVSVPEQHPTISNRPVAAWGINDDGDVVGTFNWGTARYGLFRMRGIFFGEIGPQSSLPGVINGPLSNNGLSLYTTRLGLANSTFQTAILDDDGNTVHSLSGTFPGPAFTALSLNGAFVAGQDAAGVRFVAEACETVVSPTDVDVAMAGGVVKVQVEAEEGCNWQAQGGIRRSGRGEMEWEIAASATPRVIRLVVAGKVVVIRQGADVCEFRLPGQSVPMGAAGGEVWVPLSTAEGCAWQAEVSSSGLRVEPASGVGPAAVRITVAPSNTTRVNRLRMAIGGRSFSVLQEAQACRYGVPVIPSRLGPGPGRALVEWENSPPECGEMQSDVPWIRVATPRMIAFTQNLTGAARSGTIRLNGAVYTVTQDGAAAGAPFVLEPSSPNGRRSNFHFTYLESAGAPLEGAVLEIGRNCRIQYRLGFRPFEVSGTCTLHDARTFVAAGHRTLALDMTVEEQGYMPVMADGRHMDVFRGHRDNGLSRPESKPLPVPEVLPEGSRWWVDETAGIGGTFRVSHSGAASVTSAILRFRAPGVLGECAARVDLEERTVSLVGGSPVAALGEKALLENSLCAVDAEQSGIRRMDATRSSWVLDVRMLFRDVMMASSSYVAMLVMQRDDGGGAEAMLGYYVIQNALGRSALVGGDHVARVVLRALAPVERAQFRVGTCELTYDRAAGLRSAAACPLLDMSRSGAFAFGDYLTLVLALPMDYHGMVALFANVTPQGRIASGWVNLTPVMLP